MVMGCKCVNFNHAIVPKYSLEGEIALVIIVLKCGIRDVNYNATHRLDWFSIIVYWSLLIICSWIAFQYWFYGSTTNLMEFITLYFKNDMRDK